MTHAIRAEWGSSQCVLRTEGFICSTRQELLASDVFAEVFTRYLGRLNSDKSPIRAVLNKAIDLSTSEQLLLQVLRQLVDFPLEQVANQIPGVATLLESSTRRALLGFVEGLYDFWRKHERFMILQSEAGAGSWDKRPYRSFNHTIEHLTDIVRSAYRDVCENISGDHPRVYRQVSAGCNIGLITVPRDKAIPEPFKSSFENVPMIRQVWIAPPVLLDPPVNKRSGIFRRTETDPLKNFKADPASWVCFPAQVGPFVFLVYFPSGFMGLGCALSNLFELATDEQLKKPADGVYAFGVPMEHLSCFGEDPTVFFDGYGVNGSMSAAVPFAPKYAYFGYLKKMILTLHNVAALRKGRLPFHGALINLLIGETEKTVLVMGDTATGKSETLEALRAIGNGTIRDIRVIADDMGSVEIKLNGELHGFGTEIGAFVRLDDLDAGYAFSRLDRSIVMSPQKTNARVVLPVSSIDDVLRGYKIDMILYANNHDALGAPIEFIESRDAAIAIFAEGAAQSKGTTTASGITRTYYGNPFGAPQCMSEHDVIAYQLFDTAFKNKIAVGQLRTRLGIAGCERSGPLAAAKALLSHLNLSGA